MINISDIPGTLYAKIDNLCIPIKSPVPNKEHLNLVKNSIGIYIRSNKLIFKYLKNYEIIMCLLLSVNDNPYMNDPIHIIINYMF
jgi:hypothetical protein